MTQRAFHFSFALNDIASRVQMRRANYIWNLFKLWRHVVCDFVHSAVALVWGRLQRDSIILFSCCFGSSSIAADPALVAMAKIAQSRRRKQSAIGAGDKMVRCTGKRALAKLIQQMEVVVWK